MGLSVLSSCLFIRCGYFQLHTDACFGDLDLGYCRWNKSMIAPKNAWRHHFFPRFFRLLTRLVYRDVGYRVTCSREFGLTLSREMYVLCLSGLPSSNERRCAVENQRQGRCCPNSLKSIQRPPSLLNQTFNLRRA